MIETVADDKIVREPGVYFGLDEDIYHRSPWLGSTDIRRVLRSAPDFWWHSWMNPARPEDAPNAARIFGRAVHKRILEGAEAFTSAYAPTFHPGNIKAGISERKAIADAGKTALKDEDFGRIAVAGSMIALNPNLADAFRGGMSEVSIFWCTDDGIPLKCRLDYLKVRAVTDLKSIRNSREVDFVQACRSRAAEGRQEIQARHYMNGRRTLAEHVAAGRVFGDHDPAWLHRVAAVEDFAFVFVFWQAEDAPITWAYQLSPHNPILEYGQRAIDAALDRYRDFQSRFAPDQAWVLAEPIAEMDESELPAWWRPRAV